MKRILAILIVLLFVCGSAFATTRSLQFDALLAGIMDDDGNPLSGGLVYFYEAGTTTAKNVYTDKAKTAPYTYVTLGTDGRVHVYGDGLYKVIIKTSAGVVYDTWDYVYIRSANYYSRTVTSSASATQDDDFILCNTNGGSITITLPSIADDDVSHPLIVKRNGSNTVVIDGYSAETVDGSATFTISVDKRSVELVSDGTNWQVSAIPVSSTFDADGDTGIQVEEGADEDIIRFDIGGTEQVTIQDGSIEPTTDNDVDLGASDAEFKSAYFDGTVTTDTLVVSTTAGEGVGSSLIPTTDGTRDLGANSYEWKDVFVDGTVRTDTLNISAVAGEGVVSDIVPTVDNSADLGNSSYEWKDVYIDGTLYVDTVNTVTEAELSQLDNVWSSITTSATPAAGSCGATITFKDAAGTTMATPVAGLFYLSEEATGLSIASPDTSIAVLLSGDIAVIDESPGTLWHYVTTVDGLLSLNIISAADDYYIVFIHPTGKLVISTVCTVNAP